MADKPVTREEKYLAYLTGDYTGEIPKPITRKEKYLYELCLKGIGGEISPEEIKAAVNEYLEKNPVKPGATTEQVQQIEQNRTDITSLKTETNSLKEDLENETTNRQNAIASETNRATAEEKRIEELFSLPTEEAVNKWLNDHPEATTTVQDGSLTESKFASNFLPYIKNEYVTPEMFGAAGDGVTDDTAAVQKAFDSDARVILLAGKYYTSESLVFKGSNRSIIGAGIIKYNGSGYALYVNGYQNSIEMSVISAVNGNGIAIDATISNGTFCQYITFKNIDIRVGNICIEAIRDSSKWVNEIKFENIRFSGKIGFNFDGDFLNGGYRFINCANEVCSEWFIKAYNLSFITIVGLRTEESFQNGFVNITNKCESIVIVCNCINANKIILSKKNSDGCLVGTIYDDTYSRIGCIGRIKNGLISIANNNKYIILNANNDIYDYLTRSEVILPAIFVLRYIDGGHEFTIKLPGGMTNITKIIVSVESGLHSLNLYVNNHNEKLTFDTAGIYEIRLMLDRFYKTKLSNQ